MPTAVCNGFDLHYADTGQGAPIVFLNGLGGDHLSWMGQVRACAKNFRCVALDLRDCGRSSYAKTPYTLGDVADDVAALLQFLDLPAAVVVGLSLGGMAAQELALRHPGRISGLMLVSTVARTDDWFRAMQELLRMMRRQAKDAAEFFETLLPLLVSPRFFEVPGQADWLRALMRQNPYPQQAEGTFRQLDAVCAFDAIDRLPALKCPTRVVVGEDDLLTPPRYSRQLVERVAGAMLTLLPGVGHAPPLEDGRGFNRVLLEFLGA